MNSLFWLVESSFSARLTLALLHFLWQGCCIGLLIVLFRPLLWRASARTRYLWHVMAMIVMAACLPMTFAFVGSPRIVDTASAISTSARNPHNARAPDNVDPAAPAAAGGVVVPINSVGGEGGVHRARGVETSDPTVGSDVEPNARIAILPSWLPHQSAIEIASRWIATIYLFGVACILGRLLVGVWGGHRLRRMTIAIEDETLLESFRILALRVGLRTAPALALCEQVSIPVVVGIIRPMILLPMAVVSSLAPDQLQALLLHELSHIRRLDPIVNLIQRVVEAVLFFHPVVWWVSRQISIERELAADDMVLAAGWDRPIYADALLRVAELSYAVSGRDAIHGAAVLGAVSGNRSEFKRRVLRLLGEAQPPKLDLLRGGMFAAPLLVVMGGVFAWSQSASSPRALTQDALSHSKTRITNPAPVNHESDAAEEPLVLAEDPRLKALDTAPMVECRALIRRLDEDGDEILGAQARERLAQRWKSISERPVAAFLRELPKGDPAGEIRNGGERIGVQTDLDGVWSQGKGTADNWTDWIQRKQNDYRVGRLQLLFEAAERYRKRDDAASAKRALITGLSGHEIYDADLRTLIEKYWPITSDVPAKTLGSGPEAWTLANYLTELSSAQQSLGEIDQAINTHSRLMLVHFMLSWNAPSAGPTQHARELWSLVRKKPEATPPLFWFNVVDEEHSTKHFDLSTAGQKDRLLTYHHENLTAAPLLDFAELKITAKTRGRKGILDCNRINREGKHESIGVLQPLAEGEVEQTLTKTLTIPPGTGLVQFMVAGDDIQVGEVTVEAAFVKRPEKEIKASVQSRGDRTPEGARILRKPAILLPDHWIMNAVAFDREDQELVTVANQGFATIRRWDLAAKQLISEIKLQSDVHGRQFRDSTFVFSADRKKVVGATDAYVGIWDTTTGELLKKLAFPTKHGIYDCEIDKLDCTADLSLIAGNWAMPGRLTLAYDAHVMIWDGATGELLQNIVEKGATNLQSIDLSADGKLLATTNGDGANVWSTSTGQQLLHVSNDNSGRKHSDPKVAREALQNVWSIQLSPNGRQLAMGDLLGVKLIEIASGKLIRQLEGFYRYSNFASPAIVFSPDGQKLARLGTRGEMRGDEAGNDIPIWSTQTGELLFNIHAAANTAAFSPDGKQLAVGFSDFQQAVAIWRIGENAIDPEMSEGPGPHSRQDRIEENGHYRGKVAAEHIEKFKPIWSEAKLGIEYGIALTKPQREFRIGERVPLVVFFRNASDKPLKIDTQPDGYSNTPRLVDPKGATIKLDNVPLLGHIPHYYDELEPGEALGPFYLSFGLGENPAPGKQHWHPFLKAPDVGRYQLTHSVALNVSGTGTGEKKQRVAITSKQIEFEISKEAHSRPED
jgi:beta-lactamase regulating signal transducer with metallopeptidase domain